MTADHRPQHPTPEALRRYLAAMAAARPSHAPVVRALEELLIARAGLAARLARHFAPPDPKADPAAFAAGRPLLPLSSLPLPKGAAALLRKTLSTPLVRAFPALAPGVQALEEAFAAGRMRLPTRLRAFLATGRLPAKAELAAFSTTEEACRMFFDQMVKTLAEAAALARIDAGTDFSGWKRGYCPLCGSLPELSFLSDKEGVRRLSCSRCASIWRYTRVACPVCETTDQNAIELLFLEDAPLERVEICHACGRYVLAVDPRQRSTPFYPALEPLALLHLDVIAQEKGFTPASAEPPVTA